MESEAPATEREVLRRTSEIVRSRLPEGWRTEAIFEQGGHGPGAPEVTRPDRIMTTRAPDGSISRFIFESKTSVERRDVPRLVTALRLNIAPGSVPVLAARYLSRSVRDDLEELGISYVDATGNLRIQASTPGIFLADRGADGDPWRGTGRPRGTLKGEPAARVIRSLIDFRRAWKVRELIETSGASTGATYRVLEYLQREGFAEKVDKRFVVPSWQRVLRAWSGDESFLTVNRIARYLEPRGLEAFELKVASSPRPRAAFTGSIAARVWAPYAPAKAAFVYVSSLEEAADAWQLRANDTAPSVILLEPKYSRSPVFENTTDWANGIVSTAPSQVAADLLNSPGRGPAEGEMLIEWMTENESKWRRG